jgi:hypothetical protein
MTRPTPTSSSRITDHSSRFIPHPSSFPSSLPTAHCPLLTPPLSLPSSPPTAHRSLLTFFVTLSPSLSHSDHFPPFQLTFSPLFVIQYDTLMSTKTNPPTPLALHKSNNTPKNFQNMTKHDTTSYITPSHHVPLLSSHEFPRVPMSSHEFPQVPPPITFHVSRFTLHAPPITLPALHSSSSPPQSTDSPPHSSKNSPAAPHPKSAPPAVAANHTPPPELAPPPPPARPHATPAH